MTFTGLLILASGICLVAMGSIPEVSRRVREMFYGWVLAALGALVMALGIVPLFNGLPVWNPVLRNTFGWSAGQMSWAFAIAEFEGGVFGPVGGVLIDKLGPRRMLLIGMLTLGFGFVLFSQIQELWQLYAVFVVMSLGATVGSWLPMMTLMNQWFIRNRTRAIALVMEGLALGGVIVPILLAWTIGGVDPSVSERYGWRTSALFIGILAIALAFPLSRLVRNRPSDLGLQPDGDPALPAAASQLDAGVRDLTAEEEGYTWQEAIRTATFWFMSFGHGASSIVAVSIFVHLGLILDDRGFSLQTISLVVAVHTGVSVVSTLLGGYLGDRLPLGLLAFGFSSLQSVGLLVLVFAQNVEMIFLFAMLLGTGFGARTPIVVAIRGAYFGRKAFGAITGISMVPVSILLLIAPVFAGYMRDVTGNYNMPFLIIAAASFFGSVLFLLLGEPAKPPVPVARRPLAAN